MVEFTYEKVSQIIEAQKDAVENNRNYQILVKAFLNKVWDERNNHGILFCLCILPTDVENLKFDVLSENLNETLKNVSVANFIRIDNLGNLVEKKILRRRYSKNKRRVAQIFITVLCFFLWRRGNNEIY